MKHTPTPWTNRTGTLIMAGTENNPVIVGQTSGRTSEEAVANGLLFNAAPKMLETLKAVRSFCLGYNHGKVSPVTAMIDAAVAEAEGNSDEYTIEEEPHPDDPVSYWLVLKNGDEVARFETEREAEAYLEKLEAQA